MSGCFTWKRKGIMDTDLLSAEAALLYSSKDCFNLPWGAQQTD